MELVITRDEFDDQCTQGIMQVNGEFQAFTLEPRLDQSQGKPYAIPEGRYQVELQFSNHFQRIVPLLLSVPGFSGVEIHIGNKPADTHGCTLIGTERTKDWTSHSTVAFNALMAKLTPIYPSEKIWATYTHSEATV